MFSDILGNTGGAVPLTLAAMIIFIVCFAAVVIWAMKLDKHIVNEMAHLPLNDGAAPVEDRGNHE